MKIGNMKSNKSASNKFFNYSVIYGKDAEHATPYMTRITVGRLRFHIFHRGDQDADCHDHPWWFVTFPLTSYVEEVAEQVDEEKTYRGNGNFDVEPVYQIRRGLVQRFRFHYRPAYHTHRVLGKWSGEYHDDGLPMLQYVEGNIYTFVWRGPTTGRAWGFLKNRLGHWCRVTHIDYIWGGGKEAPCGDAR